MIKLSSGRILHLKAVAQLFRRLNVSFVSSAGMARFLLRIIDFVPAVMTALRAFAEGSHAIQAAEDGFTGSPTQFDTRKVSC